MSQNWKLHRGWCDPRSAPTGRELDARTAVTGARGQTQQVEYPLPERPPYGVLS